MSAEAMEQTDDAINLPFSLPLELTIHDPETIHELVLHPEGDERDHFATRAMRIGVLALRQARGHVDRETMRQEGDRLMETLQTKLGENTRFVHERMTGVLREYFDPKNGRFQERVDRLVEKDGDLEKVLRQQVGCEDSELAKTLLRHLGEESPLMKVLDPDQSKGLLANVRLMVEQQLLQQRESVLKEFSLDNKEGALARLIQELSNRHGELSERLQGKLDVVAKEFSLDSEDSALSRLVRNVDRAQRTITSEFSLDDEASALARLRRELNGLLKEQQETNRKFQEEVKSALQAMTARREESEKSTRHGLDFEDALFQLIQSESQKASDVATHTGNTTGLIKNCKIGDCTVQLGPDSAAPGTTIVIEAKEQQGYSLQDALAEIEQARKNRGAQVGVFVFSKRTAPEGLEPFARYGQDIIVVWDLDDVASDLFIRVSLTLGRALCLRGEQQRESSATDWSRLERAILEVEKRAGGLNDIGGWAETIQKRCDDILNKVRTTRRSLDREVASLREVMDDLKVDYAASTITSGDHIV